MLPPQVDVFFRRGALTRTSRVTVLFRVILGVRAGILGSVLIATAAVYLVRRSRGGALGR